MQKPGIRPGFFRSGGTADTNASRTVRRRIHQGANFGFRAGRRVPEAFPGTGSVMRARAEQFDVLQPEPRPVPDRA